MAIRLVDQYPNRVGAPDADYPHGIPRNRSAPGATDGTPYEQSWYRDQEGYFQGLLETAGITPSGNPDTVEASDYIDALVSVAHGVAEVPMDSTLDTTLGIYPARVAALRLTGALSNDVELIVPDTERLYWIIDETTGGFSVTVRTGAGSGVSIGNPVEILRSDGSNVLRSQPGPSQIQLANYDPFRTYETGETCRGSDGVFYEFYDRDQSGTIQGVDPTNAANRPAVWMEWDGVRPGSTIEWRSTTLPEGYVENDGSDISRDDYRRVFAALGTVYGAGDGSTTFGLPDDRAEFKRGWDNGRGVDSGRVLENPQAAFAGSNTFDITTFGAGTGTAQITDLITVNGTPIAAEGPETKTVDVTPGDTRPRNNAVIWLTKI